MKYLYSAAISAVGVLCVSLAAGSANAAGITYVLGASNVSGLSEFNDGTAPGYSFDAAGTLSAAGNIRQDNTGINASPLFDGSKYLVVQPTGSGDTVAPFTTGAIFYNSPTLLNTFGIYWASVDKSNTVEFFKGGVSLGELTGLSVFGDIGSNFGNRTSPISNRFVTFNSDSGFDRMKFSTGQIAFEFDSKPVPVPAIVPGIALAAAFFGSKAIKRNKKDASESVA